MNFSEIKSIDDLVKTAIESKELSLPTSLKEPPYTHPAAAGFGALHARLSNKITDIIHDPAKATEYGRDALQLLDALFEQFRATTGE